MRMGCRWVCLAVVLAGGTAGAEPSYLNERGELVRLTVASDRIAVVPAAPSALARDLRARPELSFDGSVIEHPAGLVEIPLAATFQGRGDEAVAALRTAGLIQRTGMVFAVPGASERFLLDREVIVRLRVGVFGLPKQLLAPTGLNPIEALNTSGTLFRCQAEDSLLALDGSRAAANLQEVSWAVPDFLVPIRFAHVPNDTYYSMQWHHKQASGVHIRSEEAWDVTTGDPDVVVAVIDTGVDMTHPDLDPSRLVHPYNLLTGGDDPTPPGDCLNSHGTFCAGEIGATMDNNAGVVGVCPGCALMPIRMADGAGSVTSLSNGYKAINYAVENGAAVISSSWTIPPNLIGQVPLQPFYSAFENAAESGRGGAGTVLVFATGNEGATISSSALSAQAQVMGVGAATYLDQWASYSNYGSSISVVAPSGTADYHDPAIVTTDTSGSDGENRAGEHWHKSGFSDVNTHVAEVDAAGDYTKFFTGTSAACPLVAGLAGLMLSANPALTAPEVRLIIEQTAAKVGGVTYDGNGFNTKYGHGRIDAGRAVRAAEIGLDRPSSSQCAEDLNCANDDCQKASAGDFYGTCGGVVDPCTTLPPGSACDDGDPCTTNDVCGGGACQGTAKACADTNPCTTDACNPQSGECTHAANTGACDDGDACTLNDSCASGTCSGAARVCNDGNPCTDDACSPATGCTASANSSACDDGLYCTATDSCSAGTCQGTGNPCGTQACVEATSSCKACQTNPDCDDANPCTTDACDNGACTSTLKDCSGMTAACQSGACNIQTGQCELQPIQNGMACEDGNLCTINDMCQNGACQSGIDTCAKPPADSGCGCAAAGQDLPSPLAGLLLLAGLFWRRRGGAAR